MGTASLLFAFSCLVYSIVFFDLHFESVVDLGVYTVLIMCACAFFSRLAD